MNTSSPHLMGRYEIRGTLGSGSFATVYLAFDPTLGREVALKALFPHLATMEEDRKRFLAEGRALATAQHLNIVAVYDVGEANGRPYFTMELVNGQSLDRVMAHGKGIPMEPALRIIGELGSALDHLHRVGLVHRDVKPANVMVTPTGTIKLMDLGIALVAGRTRLTQAGFGLGTAEYVAPEQIQGHSVGSAADIYALGVLAFHLLAGRLPFNGDVAHLLYAHAHLPPPSLCDFRPDIPSSVDEVIRSALAKDPAVRPPSAGVFAERLSLAVRPGGNGRVPLVEASSAASREQLLRLGGLLQARIAQLSAAALQPHPKPHRSKTPAVILGKSGSAKRPPAPRPMAHLSSTHPLRCDRIHWGRRRLFGARCVAFTLDWVLGFAGFFLCFAILFAIFGRRADWTAFPSLAYWFAYAWWGSASGRSPGKQIVGIRVVREATNAAPGLLLGLARLGAYLVSLAPLGVGFFWPLWDRKRQAWHDKLTHTIVVRDSR